MRYKFFVLTVVCITGILLLSAGCQEQAKTTGQAEAEIKVVSEKDAEGHTGGKIVFETDEHNFGAIGPGTKNYCEFKFKNTGDDVLHIKRIQSTCGCTVPKLSKKDYEPGEEGTMKVTYKAGKSPGKVAKQLYVHLEDNKTPKVKLTIKAEIIIQIAFKPRRLDLSLRDENAGCPEVKLSSKDGKAFAIKGFKSTDDIMSIDFDPNAGATEFVIQPKVDTEKLRERLNGRLDIQLTHPETKAVTITFVAKTEFKVNPPSIIIFNTEPGEVVEKQLWVLSNYDEDFEIVSVSSQRDYIKVVSQEKVDNRYKLEVEIMPPELDEQNKKIFTDVLNVKMKGGQRVDVSCRGFYVKVPKR